MAQDSVLEPERGEPRVSLDQWRILQAIVEYGSYARAAEVLRKSQSSLSYAIDKMEHQLDLEVLVVRGRKAELTEAGEMLLRRSRYLLDEALSIENAAGALVSGWEAEVRVAVDQVFPESVWLDCLAAFEAVAPATRLDVLSSTLSGTQDAVVHKQVDLAVMGHVPPGYVSDFLLTVEFVLVVHPEHPLARLGRPLNEHDLKGQKQIVVRDTGARRRLDSGWLGAERRWTVSHFAQAIRLLQRNLGFAWLPAELAAPLVGSGYLKRLVFPEGGKSPVNMDLVLADAQSSGPATRALADLLRTHSARAAVNRS